MQMLRETPLSWDGASTPPDRAEELAVWVRQSGFHCLSPAIWAGPFGASPMVSLSLNFLIMGMIILILGFNKVMS